MSRMDERQDLREIIAVLILLSPWGMMISNDSTGIFWLLWVVNFKSSGVRFVRCSL